MLHAQTKLTTQGQVSVPAAFRNLMGLTPGSILEWTQDGDTVRVRRAVKHSSLEVHQALFPQGSATAPAKTLDELKQGIRQHMHLRHAGG
jgi:AbrB family looped-hinge helix DNA binding protein